MKPANIKKLTYSFKNTKEEYNLEFIENLIKKKGFILNNPEIIKEYNLKEESEIDITDESLKEISFNIKLEEYLGDKLYRYGEGQIIRTLENLGIGRPSTYNNFSTILIKRRYAFYDARKSFSPTKLGINTNK
jgi:DNA topoisomerase IA